uniref:Integrase zinc-binding domain-containing protein n=1 Tax=Anopheles arabiensis TaxID=7173 RepID=A0A182I5D7_ANOAR
MPLDPPDEDDLERKRKVLVAVSSERTEAWAERFSQFWRCLKVTAYCLRFVKGCRKSGEMYPTKMALVKMLQQEHFVAEIKELASGRVIAPSSKLKKLEAFLDKEGLLRIGGRLSQLAIPYTEKHSLILPDRAHLTKLLPRVYHLRAMHGGLRATLAAMRREFWPINGRSVVNGVCRSCVICFKAAPTTVTQPSGQLPEPRATPSRPFSVVGMDYCGPFYL